jgi:oxygen-independent coproporphyrinogen-3 oxidase
MDASLAQRLSASVPRYTSYPTAPHFTSRVDGQTYAAWLGRIEAGARLSLYVHLPFCDRLCWFCACATKQVHRYDPVSRYVGFLEREIGTVSAMTGGRGRVTALHFGGGSPTLMTPGDWLRVVGRLRDSFEFGDRAEISVEIDPNDMDEARHRALAEIGMTRASLGVQDFDPRVQQAINRIQSFEQTRAVVDAVRAHGVRSVNLDLIYGLPHQTVASVSETVTRVLRLAPDRIALFGYAHVPWMKKHQTMIDEAVLPDTAMRFAQAEAAAALLVEAGYLPIGIDHFALPGDTLAHAARHGGLHRNFQGYTTDDAEAMIGLGASAIGRLPQGYVQNSPATTDYERRIDAEGLATVRGFELGPSDLIRGFVIEQLMCAFAVSARGLRERFGEAAETVIAMAGAIAGSDEAGLFVRTGDGYAVTDRGRPYTRLIAARFDEYLERGTARHSRAI